MQPSSKKWLDPLVDTLRRATDKNADEVKKLCSHYDLDLKSERFENYSDIFSEYFKAYGEFNQTLLYVRLEQQLDAEKVATSTNFDLTKMFYGNAFEVLGSHLDLPAAINNILSGRLYDQMEKMDLKQYRTINKANRTTCFVNNQELSWLVSEYDSTVRNASHHRWFKLNQERNVITYRSGGTGATNKISYAEYLYRCNKLTMQLMSLACIELWLIKAMGKSL